MDQWRCCKFGLLRAAWTKSGKCQMSLRWKGLQHFLPFLSVTWMVGLNAPLAGLLTTPVVWCGRAAMQRDHNRLKRCPHENLMTAHENSTTFNKVKHKVLHRDQMSPKNKYRLGGKWIQNSPEEEEDLEMLAMKSSTCTLATQKDNHILGCIKSTVTSRWGIKVLLPL